MERKREQVYAEWLSAQLDRIGGARLDVQRTKLVSFQRTRAIRKLHARYSEGPDAVMRGILTITDAEAFFQSADSWRGSPSRLRLRDAAPSPARA